MGERKGKALAGMSQITCMMVAEVEDQSCLKSCIFTFLVLVLVLFSSPRAHICLHSPAPSSSAGFVLETNTTRLPLSPSSSATPTADTSNQRLPPRWKIASKRRARTKEDVGSIVLDWATIQSSQSHSFTNSSLRSIPNIKHLAQSSRMCSNRPFRQCMHL